MASVNRCSRLILISKLLVLWYKARVWHFSKVFLIQISDDRLWVLCMLIEKQVLILILIIFLILLLWIKNKDLIFSYFLLFTDCNLNIIYIVILILYTLSILNRFATDFSLLLLLDIVALHLLMWIYYIILILC